MGVLCLLLKYNLVDSFNKVLSTFNNMPSSFNKVTSSFFYMRPSYFLYYTLSICTVVISYDSC